MKLMEKDTDASTKLTSIACVYMCCKCVRQTDFCQIFRYLGGFARKYEKKNNIMVGSHHLVYNPISRGCAACMINDDKIVNNPKDVIMDSNIPGLIGQHYKHYNSALKLLVNGGTFADVMQYVSNHTKVPRTRCANSDTLRRLILDQSHMFTDDELFNPPSDDTRVSLKSMRKRKHSPMMAVDVEDDFSPQHIISNAHCRSDTAMARTMIHAEFSKQVRDVVGYTVVLEIDRVNSEGFCIGQAKCVIDACVNAYNIWWKLDEEQELPVLYALKVVKPDLETAQEILKDRGLSLVALESLIEVANKDPMDVKRSKSLFHVLGDEKAFSDYIKVITDFRVQIRKCMFCVYEDSFVPDEDLNEVRSSVAAIEKLWSLLSAEQRPFYRDINILMLPTVEECKNICNGYFEFRLFNVLLRFEKQMCVLDSK